MTFLFALTKSFLISDVQIFPHKVSIIQPLIVVIFQDIF